MTLDTLHNIYLALGTNLGERFGNLRRAIDALKTHVEIEAVSPVYETEPWGDTDQPAFLNLCLAGSTMLTPFALLPEIKRIEATLGRVPTYRWGPRLIDIDILFYDKLILQNDQLTIPHPHMAERAFVLAPLADIAADFRHPKTDATIEEMLARVDRSSVTRLSRSVGE